MALTLPRRGFLAGILAMPAVVRADWLMPVSPRRGLVGPDWRKFVQGARIDYACVPPGMIVRDLSYDFVGQEWIFSPPDRKWFTLTAAARDAPS
jgi:hypothetical protein